MNLHKKNYEIITDELRRIIEAELIKPGEKLDTIDQLAVQYRVGRSTVREAPSHLKALGLVESRQPMSLRVRGPYISGSICKTTAMLGMGDWKNQVYADGVARQSARWPNAAVLPECWRGCFYFKR